MIVFRMASASKRACFALAMMLLALRLLSPAGFMPAFDHGAVTIVICPDADPFRPAMAGHHGGHSKKDHQSCPYAAASAFGAVGNGAAPLAALIAVGLALSIGRPFAWLEPYRTRDRPPLRGPPLPA